MIKQSPWDNRGWGAGPVARTKISPVMKLVLCHLFEQGSTPERISVALDLHQNRVNWALKMLLQRRLVRGGGLVQLTKTGRDYVAPMLQL